VKGSAVWVRYAVYVIVGGNVGYVGRDGRRPEVGAGH
jgi:hypothetical protein